MGGMFCVCVFSVGVVGYVGGWWWWGGMSLREVMHVSAGSVVLLRARNAGVLVEFVVLCLLVRVVDI